MQTADVPKVQTEDVPKVQTADVPKVQTEDVPKVQTEDVPKVQTEDVPKVRSEDAQPVPSEVCKQRRMTPRALRPLIVSTSRPVSPFAQIRMHSPPRFLLCCDRRPSRANSQLRLPYDT